MRFAFALLVIYGLSLQAWPEGETPTDNRSWENPTQTPSGPREDSSFDRRNPLKPLTAQQQAAYKNLIEISACAYTTPSAMFRSRVTPRIFRIPKVCDEDKGFAYQCLATVYCINPVSGGFYLEQALCKSADGNRCPPAKECALSSVFDSALSSSHYSLPVLHQKSSETVR